MSIRKFISVVFAVLFLFSAAGCESKETSSFSDDCLTVYFFDVGQADSSLLIFPGGTVMLIDSGNGKDGAKIAGFIQELGITKLDYFVCTHPHEDHIGGAPDIFRQLEISTVCMPFMEEDYKPDTGVYQDLLSAVEEENCRELYLTAGTLIVEKSSFNVTAIAPRKDSVYSDMNDYSLALLINCFTNTLLFTGDAESPSELDMLSLGINLDADILKVGHHGSASSSSEAFLSAVSPQAAVISCGADNLYGHPAPETLQRLSASGAAVYRTDTVGTVMIRCYDGGFNVETTDEILLDGNR